MNNNLYITGLSSTIYNNYNSLTSNFSNYVTISSFYINIGYNYLFQTSISSILYTNCVTNTVLNSYENANNNTINLINNSLITLSSLMSL